MGRDNGTFSSSMSPIGSFYYLVIKKSNELPSSRDAFGFKQPLENVRALVCYSIKFTVVECCGVFFTFLLIFFNAIIFTSFVRLLTSFCYPCAWL